ncbi:activating transcription factor 7-interacting protein 1 isoform X3 [Callorhinchus milii]|uniref:activating transcription factor 7-interacting protein 1 isoform X3 n=1 Tax=Callorhinchus milii TaxID=7868 RepID=UPI0004571E7F|nr:activating transcription factor 7-interacting protein 1 isoform X3 [Callorhinchus milii]|eukprot:gi/632982834/ref/XP_007908351.1/ PREDICTED: activating transcription factor 7-interacting protein 1 isoform X3 [Callorhinchus milii]
MDASEELPKKVFKARKTMRASDRQQLEAIYKSREEHLKSNDESKPKLCNGKHENGDSDGKNLLNTNCMDDVDGINDVRLGPEELQGNSIDEIVTNVPELSTDDRCLEQEDSAPKPKKMDSKPMVAVGEQQIPTVSSDTETHALLSNTSRGEASVRLESGELTQELLVVDRSCTDSQSLSEEKRIPSDSNSRSQKVTDENSLKLQSSSPSVRDKEDSKNLLDISEEAITSSIESVQEKEGCEESKMECMGAGGGNVDKDKTSERKSTGNIQLQMEEIIPILEKLAPEKENNLSNDQNDVPPIPSPAPMDSPFSELQDEQMEASASSSPTKEDCNGNLPEGAFLVLSDEDEPVIEMPPEVEEVVLKVESRDKDHKEQTAETTQEPEPNEVVTRKRFKSEDMEGSISKRRRFSGEEYEAALKVKITARGEIHETLEKIVQQIIQERLSSMQSGVFEKKLAELKKRVEKIECNKRHESLISSLQAKLMQIEKKLGSADQARNSSAVKKAQENTPASTTQQSPGLQSAQPVSPSKPYSSSGGVQCRSGTVRQMLDLRRNMLDSTSSSQPLANSGITGNAPSFTPPQVVSGQPKPQNPGSSAAMVAPVLPTSTALVGTAQSLPNCGNNQPMPVSLQSVPVLLTVPVAMSSQQPLLQASANALVTSQQTGLEFLPVQSQPTLSVSKAAPAHILPNVAKANGASPALPSPVAQRRSPASVGSLHTSVGLSNQTASLTSSQTVLSTQIARTSQQSLGSQGHFSPTNTRPQLQPRLSQTYSQGQTPGCSGQPSTSSSDGNTAGTSRAESGLALSNQKPLTTSTEASVTKKASGGGSQNGKASGSDTVIDLTGDDEDDLSAQDARKQNPSVPPAQSQLPIPIPAPPVPLQAQIRPVAPSQAILQPQSSVQVHLGSPQSSSATIGLNTQSVSLHTTTPGQPTVSLLPQQRPQMPPPTSQAPVRQQLPTLQRGGSTAVVYTTAPAYQSHSTVRAITTSSQSLSQGARQPSPQAPSTGLPVRLPHAASYIVNNVISIPMMSTLPQFTVHHRPPQQDPPRPIHPAPLPEAQPPQRLPPEAASTALPQKPHLKLARVQSQNGIVLSWSVLEADRNCAPVDSYHLYAYHEDPATTSVSQWKKIGEVKALPLPMACTLTQFVSGSKYYFAVRAKDLYGRYGPFCDPQSTDVMSTQGN